MEKIATRGLPAGVYRSSTRCRAARPHPVLEPRRGQQVVQPHRQREAVLRRDRTIRVEHADALHRRLLDLLDQRRRGRGLCPLCHACARIVREQDVLAALDRVGVDAEQAEQARSRSCRSAPAAARRRPAPHRSGAANDLRIDTGMPALLPGV